MSVLCISSHLLSPLCCVSVKVDCRFASRVKVKKTFTQCRRTLVSLFVIRLPLNNFSLDRFQIAGRDLYCRSSVEYLAYIFSNKCNIYLAINVSERQNIWNAIVSPPTLIALYRWFHIVSGCRGSRWTSIDVSKMRLSCPSSHFRHNPQILFFLPSYDSLHIQTHLMSSKTMQWRWE